MYDVWRHHPLTPAAPQIYPPTATTAATAALGLLPYPTTAHLAAMARTSTGMGTCCILSKHNLVFLKSIWQVLLKCLLFKQNTSNSVQNILNIDLKHSRMK